MADCFAVEPEDMFPAEPPSYRSTASAPAKLETAVEIDLDLDMPLKKKKKKRMITFEEEPEAAAATADAGTEAPAPAPTGGAGADLDLDIDFTKMKKKKKKSSDAAAAAEATEQAEDAPAADEADLESKKKKKRSEAAVVAALNEYDMNDGRDWGPYMEPDLEEFTYEQMLKRLYDKIHESNPEMCGDRTKARIKPPKVSRLGTTRSSWENFGPCCKSMNRTAEHVQSFFLAELDTTGAIDGDGHLVLKGRYNNKHIEGVMSKYIAQYIQCFVCKSLETEITRDPVSRLNFLCCNFCKSQRSLAAIKSGYHATTKADRKAARNAE